MKIKPFIALDVETTGIQKDQAHLLQLAMVYVDDLSKPNNEYKTLNLYVKYDLLEHVEPKAVQMVAATLSRMTEDNTVHVVELRQKSLEFFMDVLKEQKGNKIVLAGKNVTTFDLEILKHHNFQVPNISHRVLDVGSMYFEDFGYIPSLGEINVKNGKSEVQHDALQDCYDVIDAVKVKCLKSN